MTELYKGNIGLGKASCVHLAKQKAHIFLAARTPSKAEAAISEIKEAVPEAQITFLELDLASLDSVKNAAATFNAASTRLDVLMNNAGIMAVPAGLTKQGYELQFGTNHMGHALFTKLLMPKLLETAKEEGSQVRIVNVSSMGHKYAPTGGISFPSLKTDMQEYSTWVRYGQSKLANILFTKALAERYPGIKSVAIHPGGVDTNLSSGFQNSHPWLTAVLKPVLFKLLKTPEQGSLTQVFAAVSPEAESGSYYTPTAKKTELAKPAEDTELINKLWDWTEEELSAYGPWPKSSG